MTVETPSPRIQRRRARNRAALLDAAEPMFASGSYSDVRIEALAAAADLSVGSVYTHFGSKEGLFLAVAERALGLAAEYIAEADKVGRTPLEKVAATGEAYMNLLLDHPFLVRFLTSDAALPEEEGVRRRVAIGVERLYTALARQVEAATAAGQAKPLDPLLHARYLIGSWNGVCAMMFHSAGARLTVDEVRACLRQSCQVLVDGMTAPALLGPDGRSRAELRPVPRPDPGSGGGQPGGDDNFKEHS